MPTGIYVRAPRVTVAVVCRICGTTRFMPPSKAARLFCGRQCANQAKRSAPKECLQCKKLFVADRRVQFCSNECVYASRRKPNSKWRDRVQIKQYMSIYQREHREKHREAYRLKVMNRRCRKKQNGGTIRLREWLDLCKKYNHACACCEKKTKLTIDHIIPISLGGRNDIANVQPLCWPCNRRKGVKSIDYRRSQIAMFP